MEIKYYGGNCVRIQSKKVSVVIDDNLSSLGQKNIIKDTDIGIYTFKQPESVKAKFLINKPGENQQLLTDLS